MAEMEGQLSGDMQAILGLQLPTDPRWVDLASISLEEILTDHAYCEQRLQRPVSLLSSVIIKKRN